MFKSLEIHTVHGRRIFHTSEACEKLIEAGAVVPGLILSLLLTRFMRLGPTPFWRLTWVQGTAYKCKFKPSVAYLKSGRLVSWFDCSKFTILSKDEQNDSELTVSHRIPMTRFREAFDALLNGTACKIILDPQNWRLINFEICEKPGIRLPQKASLLNQCGGRKQWDTRFAGGDRKKFNLVIVEANVPHTKELELWCVGAQVRSQFEARNEKLCLDWNFWRRQGQKSSSIRHFFYHSP